MELVVIKKKVLDDFKKRVDKLLPKLLKVRTKNVIIDFVKSVKSIGSFEVYKQVLVGDIEWLPLNLRPGIYNVYMVDESPMIVHESIPKITKQSLANYAFTEYSYNVTSDSGMFGFFDSEYVLLDNNMNGGKGDTLPQIKWSTVPKSDYFFLEPQFLKDKMSALPKNEKIGFVSLTGLDVGVFPCLIHKKEIALLCGYNLSQKLLKQNLIGR